MRAFARSRDMSIEEFSLFNRKHPELGYDHKCDEEIRAFGSQNHTVIEGRLSHVFVLHGFRLLLICAEDVRAVRRQKDSEFSCLSIKKVKRLICARDRDDDQRYRKLYPGCLWKKKDFDLVLDTGILTPEEIVQRILSAHAQWKLRHAERIRYTITGT